MANLNLRSPTGYSGQPATKFRQGVVRLANDQEIIDAVANNVAVTPNQLDVVVESTFAAPPPIGSVAQNVVNATGFRAAEGANSKQGVATLVGGTVVVANTSVTAQSRIFLTPQTLGTVTDPSALGVSARTPGVSFTVLADQATDTSIIAYEIFEPAV